MKKLFSILFITLIFGTITAQDASELRLLGKWLEGSYTTEGQTLQSPRTAHQQMRFVRIWKDLPDPWFYMEQSDLSTPEKPFRQWVFWVEQQGEHIMLETHILSDTATVAGNLSAAELEKELDFEALELEDGCEIFLTYDGFAVFSGATVQNYCELEIKGSSHVTIRVNVSESQIDWWEYGMKTNEEFLWGSAQDPQMFIKQ